MPTTDVNIASAALLKIGEKAISALADSDIVNATYALHRDALLREHPWNFAIVRAALTRSLDTAQNITAMSTPSAAVEITINGHGYSDDDTVYIAGIVGPDSLNGEYYVVDEADTNTFELKGIAGSALDAWVSDGTAALALDPAWGLAFAYDLPAACLRVLLVENVPDYDWRLEGAKIATDIAEPLNIKYISQVTDPDDWDTLFVQACIAKLAWEWAEDYTKEPELRKDLLEEYIGKVGVAFAVDGQEGKTEQLPQGSWVDAHR